MIAPQNSQFWGIFLYIKPHRKSLMLVVFGSVALVLRFVSYFPAWKKSAPLGTDFHSPRHLFPIRNSAHPILLVIWQRCIQESLKLTCLYSVSVNYNAPVRSIAWVKPLLCMSSQGCEASSRANCFLELTKGFGKNTTQKMTVFLLRDPSFRKQMRIFLLPCYRITHTSKVIHWFRK